MKLRKKLPELWCIVGTTENERDPDTHRRLYWNSQWGWVDGELADLYEDEIKDRVTLPINGKWERA